MHSSEKENSFDNIVINIEELYKKFPIDTKVDSQINRVPWMEDPFHRLYRSPLIPLKYRNYLWHFFRRLHLDLTWFKEFGAYWTHVLGGRPLWGVEDFSFLKNVYRMKFQYLELPEAQGPKGHLEAWQKPEVMYQLLHYVSKESTVLNYQSSVRLLRSLARQKKINIRSILEFGCGTAPITTTLYEFFPPKRDVEIWISDIQTLPFHYAAYKFRNCSNVRPTLLVPDNDFIVPTDKRMDVIFAITVFEHLTKPLETIQRFYETLNAGGLLFFYYIKSHGHGLDTVHGGRERNDVLDFVQEHFTPLYGKIAKEKSMDLVVVQKKG